MTVSTINENNIAFKRVVNTQGNAAERKTGCFPICPVLLEMFIGDESNQERNNYFHV